MKNSKHCNKRGRFARLGVPKFIFDAVAVATVCTGCAPSFAQTTNWRGTTDSVWENPANWDNGAPNSSTSATFTGGYSQRQAVTFLSANPAVFMLTNSGIQQFAIGPSTLTITGNLMNYPVPSAGPDVFTLQSGTANVSGSSYIGGNSSGSIGGGTLQISGGTLNVAGATTGYNTGTVNTSGTLQLTGGSLNTASLNIDPSLFQFTGGTLNITNSTFFIQSGQPLGAAATLTSGQTLKVTGPASSVYLSDRGSLTVNSGSQIVATTLFVGDSSAGSMTVNSGSVIVSNAINIGNGSGAPGQAGTLTINNGGTVAAPYVNVGQYSTNTNSIAITGASSKLTVQSQLLVGQVGSGVASLNVTSGATVHATSGAYVAIGAGGGNGIITLGTPVATDSGALLLSAGGIYVGGDSNSSRSLGTGLVNVYSGTTLSTVGSLKIWNSNASSVNLLGGTISAGLLDTSGVANSFNWTNGTLNLTNSDLTVAPTGTLGSSLNLSAGKALVLSGNDRSLNLATGGTLNLSGGVLTANLLNQSGGSVNGLLLISPGNISSYSLTAGSLNPTTLQLDSGGSLTQTGGAIVNTFANLPGTINGEFIGLGGNATFNQSGGTNTTAPNTLGINLGAVGGGSGLYLISGSAGVSSSAISIDRGAVNQSGNSSNVSLQSLVVANSPGSSGTYQLTGGSLQVIQTYEFIGNSGNGTFNQTGGSHTIGTDGGNGYLFLGVHAGSAGAYTLWGGNVITTSTEYIGIDGNGIFNQSGGTNTTPDLTIVIGSGQGRYNLQAGALSADSLTVNTNGTFNQTGGSFTTSSITIASGGSVILGSNQKLTTLSIETTPGSTARLDVTSHDLIVQNTDLSSVVSLMKDGKLLSSTATNNPKHLTTLGIITNGNLYSSSKLFDGFIPSPADVLVKYTYFGDTNLDGKVDGSDYSRIDSGYLTHTAGWLNGDFNYDGAVNGSDYTLIDNAFNSQGVQLSNQLAVDTLAMITATLNAGASVPEPTSLGLVAVVAASSLSFGRKKRGTTTYAANDELIR